MVRNKLILFARAPERGQSKTRLISALGEEGSAYLSKQLIWYTIQKFVHLNPVLYCAPNNRHPFFMECADRFGIPLYDQIGDDLGMRMENAFKSELDRFSKVILIGTDCPDLTASDMENAFHVLDTKQSVFVPAMDGGYVLIGFSNAEFPPVFQNITWGTSSVLRESLKLLERESYLLLEPRRDLDEPEDLPYFQKKYPFLFLPTL